MASPACHPCYPGSSSIGYGSFCQDRYSSLPLCRRGSTTPLRISRLHIGSLTLRPAGLLDFLSEPLSGNLTLQVTLCTSLKLHGELPNSHGRPLTDKSYVLHGIPYESTLSTNRNCLKSTTGIKHSWENLRGGSFVRISGSEYLVDLISCCRKTAVSYTSY